MNVNRSFLPWKWVIPVFVCSLMIACKSPEAPEYYGFQNVQLGQPSGQQTNVSATLKFFNPNPFSLQLKRAEVDIALNGRPAGHSVLDTTIQIPRRDTFYVPVTLQVNLQSLFSNALQLLTEKQVKVTLDGHVKLKRGIFPISRPFHYEGKQDISSFMSSAGF